MYSALRDQASQTRGWTALPWRMWLNCFWDHVILFALAKFYGTGLQKGLHTEYTVYYVIQIIHQTECSRIRYQQGFISTYRCDMFCCLPISAAVRFPSFWTVVKRSTMIHQLLARNVQCECFKHHLVPLSSLVLVNILVQRNLLKFDITRWGALSYRISSLLISRRCVLDVSMICLLIIRHVIFLVSLCETLYSGSSATIMVNFQDNG